MGFDERLRAVSSCDASIEYFRTRRVSRATRAEKASDRSELHGRLNTSSRGGSGVLAHIRPEGIAILVQATTNKDQWVQKSAIEALGGNPPAEPGVVASLTRCLKSENPDVVRLSAAWALGMLQAEPEIAVPALREALNDDFVQPAVAHSLSKFGAVVAPSFDRA